MHLIAQHKILVSGDSFAACSDQVRKFFDLTSLVIYDCIQVVDELSFPGTAREFQQMVDEAVRQNRKTLESLVRELENTGNRSVSDFLRLSQGYPSKVLHIIAHLLDGFVGIDSYFYNLADDSHWLPAETAAAITNSPARYWLIHIDCYSATPDEAALLHK